MHRILGSLVPCLLLTVLLAGCGGDVDRDYRNIGTAPMGGTFYSIGGALCNVLNDQSEERKWKFIAEATGGSMENIRLIVRGEIQFALSNSSITYFAVRGTEGWDRVQEIRAVMTLQPLVAMFVTRDNPDIRSIADLKNLRVSLGPEGAGFEYFIRPILREYGLTYDDLDPVYCGQANSVGYLGDGSVKAAFLGGGIPTPSITSAASTMDIRLIPYDEDAKRRLMDKYPFYGEVTVPAGTYKGQTEDYHGMNVGAAHLVTGADVDEELVYQVTRILYEGRENADKKHSALGFIRADNVVRNTGTDFHPGAIRYYKEIGIWPEGR